MLNKLSSKKQMQIEDQVKKKEEEEVVEEEVVMEEVDMEWEWEDTVWDMIIQACIKKQVGFKKVQTN